jgi:hypothetical protein
VICAFLASAGHIFEVAVSMGNPGPIAAVHAVGLDGLVYVGIIAFQAGAKLRGAAAVIYGGAVSLAFNAAAYSDAHTLPVWVMAMSMPVSLVLGVLVGHGTLTQRDTTPAVPDRVPVPRPRVPVSQPVPVPVAQPKGHVPARAPVSRAKEWDKDKARALLAEGRPRKEIAELCGTSRKSIDRLAAKGVEA